MQKAWLTAHTVSKDSVTFAFCKCRPVSNTSVDTCRVSDQALNQTICLNRAVQLQSATSDLQVSLSKT